MENVDRKTRPDIESGLVDGRQQLYPGMMESPQFRWAFIRKVYAILCLQLLLTVAVAATVVYVRAIPRFMTKTTPGLVIYIIIIVSTFILLFPLAYFKSNHPWNFVFLFLFTLTMAFTLGLSCAFTKGKILLEAAILTSTVTIGLTLYTFWAVKRGQDFSFLGPFLFASLLMLIVFGFIQILFPLGKITQTVYGALAALIFSGYIVYDTDNLIKRYSYDDYILAAVDLYLDIVNLFIALVELLDGADST